MASIQCVVNKIVGYPCQLGGLSPARCVARCVCVVTFCVILAVDPSLVLVCMHLFTTWLATVPGILV